MKNKYLKKLICSLVITTTILVPYLGLPSKAEAQYQYSGPSAGEVAGLIPQLPGCIKFATNEIKKLFNIAEETAKAGDQASETATAVPIYNLGLEMDITQTKSKTDNISNNNEGLTEGQICLNSIGRAVVKLMLQKLVVSTIDWINHGFNGSPFFVQNPGQFFGDIAKNEILAFGIEIDNPQLFPFGKAFMQAQAQAFQKHFADNARYSLNELIQQTTPGYSDADFRVDFSKGGWNAWEYLTQVPANNPLGFQLIASDELQKRLAGTTQSTAQDIRDSLQAASGFLGQDRCADPEGVTREEDNAYLAGTPGKRHCLKWEYVTPGKVIAEKTTQALNYQDNQLLKAQDLNDAIAAIVDALLNHFSDKLFSGEGLAGFDNRGADGTFYYMENNAQFGLGNQASQDFPGYLLGSDWFAEHPNFNIRTDITQALIDEQRTYETKLEDQQIILPTLDKVIYQLDYCIPGPHPGWENEAQSNVTNAKSAFQEPPNLSENFLERGVVNASLLYGYLGISVSSTDDAIRAGNLFSNVLDESFAGYKNSINQIYTPLLLPGVASEAKTEFQKVAGYKQRVESNKDKIAFQKSIVKRLEDIKEAVDSLNTNLANGSITVAAYNENLKGWIAAFGRLTTNMVTGNEIAGLDTVNKKFQDEIDYVYKDLLKGPQGCENDQYAGFMTVPGIRDARKPHYPFSIFYDYNNYNLNQTLPDPLNAGAPYNQSKMLYQPFSATTLPSFMYLGAFTTFPSTPSVSVSFCSDIVSVNVLTGTNCGGQDGPSFIHITNLINFNGGSPQTIPRFEVNVVRPY